MQSARCSYSRTVGSKIPTMVLFRYFGENLLVVLQSCSNSANLFFIYSTTTVLSFSASVLVLDELIDFNCSSVAMQWSSCSGNRSLRPIDTSCSFNVVMLRTSRTRLRLALVGIDTSYKIAPPVYHRSRWPSCSGFRLLPRLFRSSRFSRRFLQIFSCGASKLLKFS